MSVAVSEPDKTAVVMATAERVASNGDNPKTLTESAYRHLRQDIVEGVLAPGSRLAVEHLKDRYGVGAGTLREALALLVSDALVVSRGQRGFRVAPISLADFEDITRMRILLETEALRLSIEHSDEAWEADLMGAFHRLTRAETKLAIDPVGMANEWEERNRIFHETLIAGCPSNWLRHFRGIVYRQSERYRRLSIFAGPRPRDVHTEHTALYEAALQRDSELACKILTDHILITLHSVKLLPPERLADGEARLPR
jgi:GntR family transcriptional regulator, carbon starvation induced regulator